MRKCFTTFALLLSGYVLHAQSITKIGGPSDSAVCPGAPTVFQLSTPGHLTGCLVQWSVTNGQILASSPGSVTVAFNESPGATGTVTAIYSNCSDSQYNGVAVSEGYRIWSIKGLSWGSYVNSVNVNFCTKNQVTLTVPPMYIPGSDFVEVHYEWQLPSGWMTVSGGTGTIITAGNSIQIEPVKCSVQGEVKVRGYIILCSGSEWSNAATITLNATMPKVTVTAQNFTASKVCNTTPVTFHASVDPQMSCVDSYQWTYPQGWTPVSSNGSSITLQPKGTKMDAGTITAKVNFNCGSSVAGQYVVEYLQPYIAVATDGTLKSPVCSSTDYTVGNSFGAPVTWSSSNTSIATVDSSGKLTRVGGANGEVILTASFQCDADPATDTIWVGKPAYSGVSIIRDVNDPNQNVSYVYGYSNAIQFYVSVAGGDPSYEWTITSSQSCGTGTNYKGPRFYSNGNGTTAITSNNKVNVNTGTCAGTFYIHCSAANVCGETPYAQRLFKVASNPGGGGCDYALITAPNPSQVGSGVSINLVPPPPGCKSFAAMSSLEKDDVESDKIMTISVIDGTGNVVATESGSGLSHVLNTNRLKQGIYYLKIQTVHGRILQTRIVKD